MSNIPPVQRGFSLLEILVAFSILSLSLGVLMQIFSGSLNNASITREQVQATTLAQSLLASAGIEGPLAAGESTGGDDKFRWSLSVTPFAVATQPTDRAGIRSPGLLDLWEVSVRVTWGGGSGTVERELVLTTLRVQRAGSP